MQIAETSATRACGLSRLRGFVPQMGEAYSSNRNIDPGPGAASNVSELSPFIRHRLVSEQEVASAAIEAHGVDRASKFLQEVCWRSYFKGWLEHRPAVWTLYCEARDVDFSRLESDTALRVCYADAISGRTGIEGFDDWARDLAETGYLHNHARMSFASIWIFTLRLPWTLGADFFLQHLLDGDPASNTLSWRWVAGLHTEGKTYLASRKAIEVCSDGRFSPAGLAAQADPVEGFQNPPAGPLPAASAIPEKAFGLLLTEDDLSMETVLQPGLPVAGVAAIANPALRSRHGASDKVRRFTASSVRDGLQRAGQAFCADAADLSTAEDPVAAVLDWAGKLGVEDIVVPFIPAGWSRDAALPVLTALARNGFKVHQVRRRWDEVFWPHASKGYFKLRQKIPTLLDTLGLTGQAVTDG